MKDRAADCLRRSRECDQIASIACTMDARLMYADLARRWREIAQEYEPMEQITGLVHARGDGAVR
jgi:hypothetical protein